MNNDTLGTSAPWSLHSRPGKKLSTKSDSSSVKVTSFSKFGLIRGDRVFIWHVLSPKNLLNTFNIKGDMWEHWSQKGSFQVSLDLAGSLQLLPP